MLSSFKLRPHHLLCILFFEGKGYSDSFSANMQSISENLSEKSRIEIVSGIDDICRECPNMTKTGCRSFEKTATYDKNVADIMDIKEGEYVYGNLKKSVIEKIIKKGAIGKTCKDCEWLYICISKSQNIILKG